MPTLESLARMIALQFRFSNPNALPKNVKLVPEETREAQIERRSNQTGVLIVESTENTSLAQLILDLEYFRYEIINAVSFLRSDLKDPTGRHKYHIVRYSFMPHEYVTISDEFRCLREGLLEELRAVCESVLWKAEVYSNPFGLGEEAVASGERMISINLAGRRPIVPVWQKDGEGNRLGDGPVLMTPPYKLRIDAELGIMLIPKQWERAEIASQ